MSTGTVRAAELGRDALSIAEALELLRLSIPINRRSVSWWSDTDYALAGAYLIDLSFEGVVDTDIRTVTHTVNEGSSRPPSRALAALKQNGGNATLDHVIEDIVDRIGDLRAELSAALASRKILLRQPETIVWGFVHQRTTASETPEATSLRTTLTSLIEGDDLPSPEEAALISILHASGLIGEILVADAPQRWLARHEKRIEALHRMDLVGQFISGAIKRMRDRLQAYVLGSESSLKTATAGFRHTWEWRCFWAADASVALPEALELVGTSDFGLEEMNRDIYLFVHGRRDNIKFRGKGLKVKPVIEAFDEFCAFGPSCKVSFPSNAQALSSIFPRLNEVHVKLRTREDMLSALTATGYRPGVIEVRKTRRQYRAILGVKVELALMEANGRTYHSLSLESRYLTALRVLSRNVTVGHGIVCGYGQFLEHVTDS